MENIGRSSGFNVGPGDVVAGRYELQSRLGQGGMGQVFRAIDRELDGEIVAIKLLLPHLAQDENVFRRFRNEVLVARSLTHPNIVRTHDIGKTQEGYSYISMEFIDGESLRDRLISSAANKDQAGGESSGGRVVPPLMFQEALTYLYQIICGVAYAHGKGVIHRDLKPANVLLSKTNEVKLADFGTARIVGADTSLTQTGQVIGTPDYMSPEQIRGEELDTSCDIYALGILAYELVSGKRPFMADSAVAVAFKHLNEPLPTLVVPGIRVPVWFDEIVRKAAAKKKGDRFASVNDLAGALLDFAPELSAQSTLLTADRSRRGTSSNMAGTLGVSTPVNPPPSEGSQRDEASEAKTSLEAKLTTPPSNKSGNPKSGKSKDRSFELGIQARAGEDNGEWKLGAVTFADDERPMSRHFESQSRSGMKVFWVLLAGVGASFVIPRLHSGTNIFLQEKLFPKTLNNQEPSSMNLLVGALFGVKVPDELGNGVVVSKNGNQQGGGGRSGTEFAPTEIPSVVASAVPTAATVAPTAAVTPGSGSQVSGQTVPGTSPGTSVPTTIPSVIPTVVSTPAPTAIPTQIPTRIPTMASTPESVSSHVPTGSSTAMPVTSGSPGQGPEATLVAKETEPTPAPSSIPAVERVTGNLTLRENGVTLREASISVERLAQLTWNVELSNVPSADTLSDVKIRENLQVDVFDLRRAQTVANLRVDQISPHAKSDTVLKVSGGFQALRAVQPSSGSFRVQLSYKGNRLSDKELVLYRAQVVASTTPGDSLGNPGVSNQGAGGTTITIPTEPVGAGNHSGGPVTGATPPKLSTPVNITSGNSGSGTFSEPKNEAPKSGLPVAKGHETSQAPSGAAPSGSGNSGLGGSVISVNPTTVTPNTVAPTPLPSQIVPNVLNNPSGGSESSSITSAAAEDYSGLLIPGTEGTPPMNLELHIQVSGENVSGTASIPGVGSFSVSGRVLTRGMELELKGDNWIRLTSGPRGQVLRGRYSYPAQQQSGRFEFRRR